MCAGTETPAEVHERGKVGTSDPPGSEDGGRTQPGRGTSGWTRLRRSSRGGRVEQPPAQPGWGTSDTRASKDPQLGGGSKPPTSRGPSQRMNEGLAMRNYAGVLGSVDCDERIYWNIPPPSRGIYVNVIRSVSRPYIRGAMPSLIRREGIHCIHLPLSLLTVSARTSHGSEWEGSRSTVLLGSAESIFPTTLRYLPVTVHLYGIPKKLWSLVLVD